MPLTHLIIGDKKLTFDEALELARRGETNLPYPFVKAVVSGILDRQSKIPSDQIGVTDIIGCIRQKYLMATEEYAENPDGMMFALRGQLLHQLLAKYAEEEAIVETRTFREYQGYKLWGTADSILTTRNNGRYALRDFKSTRKVPAVNPWSNHIAQTSIYRWLYELPYSETDLSVLYFDLNGGEVAERKVKDSLKWADEVVEHFLDKRFVPLAKALETKQIPLYRDIPSEITRWACGFCPLYDRCFELLLKEEGAVERYAASKKVAG